MSLKEVARIARENLERVCCLTLPHFHVVLLCLVMLTCHRSVVQVFDEGYDQPVGARVGPLKPEEAIVIFHQGDSEDDCHYSSLAMGEEWLSSCPYAAARQDIPFVRMLLALRQETISDAGQWLSLRETQMRNHLNTCGGLLPCVALGRTRVVLHAA